MLAHDFVLDQVFHVKWFVAGETLDEVGAEHLHDECRWLAVGPVYFLTHFALFLLLLQILIIQFHIEAVAAVQLATLCIVTLNWSIHDF